MGLINDVLAADSLAFVDPDISFGETITYTPRSGSARTINAVVDRDPLLPAEESLAGARKPITITVRNDATYGIAMSQFNSGGDKVTLAYRLGVTAEDFLLVDEPQAQDNGMITFTIR